MYSERGPETTSAMGHILAPNVFLQKQSVFTQTEGSTRGDVLPPGEPTENPVLLRF